LIKLNEHREKYLNDKAECIVNLITVMPKTNPNFGPLKGSRGEVPIIDLRGKLSLKDKPIMLRSKRIDKYVNCIEEYQNKTYGLDKESYNEFEKFVDSIIQEKTISASISRKFIESKSLGWIFGVYRKEINEKFIDYIMPILIDSIKSYEFTFRILYLHIETSFEIGNCKVYFFKNEQLNTEEEKYVKLYPDRKEFNTYTHLKKDYLGIPLISTTVKAEYRKAKEQAINECSISIDAIKLCSLTTFKPNYKSVFDIDNRIKFNNKNTNLYKINDDSDYAIETQFAGQEYDLNNKEMRYLINRGLAEFHIFLKQRYKYETELSELIKNSIAMYAESISKTDLHKRIVNLFTILESLLLKNEDIPIIDSVTKYLPRLIYTNVDDRKEIIKVVKRLYAVRSGMIHHAKRKKFELDDLKLLQISIVRLLLSLTKQIEKHKSKYSILDEIDEKLLMA